MPRGPQVGAAVPSGHAWMHSAPPLATLELLLQATSLQRMWCTCLMALESGME